MASLTNHQTELDTAWKILHQRWKATSEVWTDQVHDDFATQYMEPLAQQSQTVARNLERLAQIVSKAQRAVK